jgi:hypothetical protein
MGRWIRRQGPTFVVACLALMVALGGSVYAASRIDGHQVKPGSLPGNRVKPGSLPGNRLAPGTLRGSRIEDGSLTGAQVDAATLAKVPEATHADAADTARSAGTALSATRAAEAERLNGHSAGCAVDQRLFAGSCWDLVDSPPAAAKVAAAACASRGGSLPQALALTAFAKLPGIELSGEGEWSGDIMNVSSPDGFATVTVGPGTVISSAGVNETRPFRCTFPLVN